MHTSFTVTLSELQAYADKRKFSSNKSDFEALEEMFASVTDHHDDSYDIVITGMIEVEFNEPTLVPYGETYVPLNDGSHNVVNADIEDIFCRLHSRTRDTEIFTETELLKKKVLANLEDLIEHYFQHNIDELDTTPDVDPPEAPEPDFFEEL